MQHDATPTHTPTPTRVSLQTAVATARFSHYADDYARFRPRYPESALDFVIDRAGLRRGDVVADLGAGTGLFTAQLLARGLRLIAVEPNAKMRAAADATLGVQTGYNSVPGRAEHTGLADTCVRCVTIAQAFHWLDTRATRAECRRVLVPGGHVAVIFNLRRVDTPFMAGYEALLQARAPDYQQAGLRPELDERPITAFFALQGFARAEYRHVQHFDRDGIRGRLLSSSFVPRPGEPGCAALCDELDALFDRCQAAGRVDFAYRCVAFVGRLDPVQS